MTTRGAVVRSRRQELDLELQAVASATRIPLAHLEAIEADDLAALPDGPYAVAYLRALEEYLEVDLRSDEVGRSTAAQRSGSSLALARVVAGGTIALLVGLMVWVTWPQAATDAVPQPAPPDQVVKIKAQRNLPLKVVVDGETVFDKVLVGGQSEQFAGHREVIVEVDAVQSARIWYNGSSIAPQGRQDSPRRLVFVDDLEAP